MIAARDLANVLSLVLLTACGESGEDNVTAGDQLQPECDNPLVLPDESCRKPACEYARCGTPDSYLDEFLCNRKACETQQDCGTGLECREIIYTRVTCAPNLHGDGLCVCGGEVLSSKAWLCVPPK